MRGRVALIAVASLMLATAYSAGSAAAPRLSAHRGRPAGPGEGRAALPIGCTHGGLPFRTHGPRGRKRIAIGFDDGPSDYTLSVLRVLRRFNSHATFFEIGQEVPGRSQTMKKILAQGNEIGNHSLHHESDPSSGSLHETNRLIRGATGFRPCDFRPPDGHINSALIARAHAEHLVTVNWDVDPRRLGRPRGRRDLLERDPERAQRLDRRHARRRRKSQRDRRGPAVDPLPLPPPWLQVRHGDRTARPPLHLPEATGLSRLTTARVARAAGERA